MYILDGKGRPRTAAALLAAVADPVSSWCRSCRPRSPPSAAMFAGLGRESLGWLLVDEAGQAAPQTCRRRAVAVPARGARRRPAAAGTGRHAALGRAAGPARAVRASTPVWAPSRSSAQQLADRLAVAGTALPGRAAGEEVWVGAPLRVHRRCDRPMFEVSNAIAYDGLMVFGTPADRKPFHGENAWSMSGPAVRGSNWIQAEGDLLRWVLAAAARQRRGPGVTDQGDQPLPGGRGERGQAIFRGVFPEASNGDLDQWIGTVHTHAGPGGRRGHPRARRRPRQAGLAPVRAGDPQPAECRRNPGPAPPVRDRQLRAPGAPSATSTS